MSLGLPAYFLNLDGSLPPQGLWCDGQGGGALDMRQWGPRIRMGCSHGMFARFGRDLDAALPAQPGVICYGSGDFHHVSLALLRRISEPFNLVIFDKHPDWMHRIPILHCGTWVAHAARLENVRKIFHFGGDLDFDNAWRHLAPWPLLRDGRIVVLPAKRRYDRGGWRAIPTYPLNSPQEQIAAAVARDLARYPIYLSIDKDVLRREDAVVNWDSGNLSLDQLMTWLDRVVQWSGGRCVGADLLGDYSPVRMQGLLRHFLNWTGHPRLELTSVVQATRINQDTNARILSLLAEGIRREANRANALGPMLTGLTREDEL